MANYAKFDKIEDSDDEKAEERKEEDGGQPRGADPEERARQLEQKEVVDTWLKARMRDLFPPPVVGGPPELDPWEDLPPRRVTEEERKVLAMFMVVNHFERFEINIGRHHDILNLARQNRWLEEDPGTLELLCQLLRKVKKEGGQAATEAEGKVEDRLVSAINTLAAPPRAGCSDGYGKIYELFASISDPQTDTAWEARAKYVKKEYAADAIFLSMMPRSADDEGEQSILTNPAVVIIVVLILISIFCICLAAYLQSRGGGGARSGGALPRAPGPPPDREL